MATPEGFLFAGVNWNDFTNFRIQEFDPGIAPKRWQWISGDDADGAVLPEEAHYDNGEMTVRIRITPQASMDAALAKIGQLVDTLQECEQNPLGSPAVWTPAGSTKSLTAYILGGEVTGIPITLDGDDAGWFLKNPAPVVVMKLYRRPFLYGTEVTSAATVTDTNPAQILTVANVTGDVPAEARLVVTDAATQSRRHVEWGLQWRYYDAATSLILDSDNLVTTGFAGVGTTRTGAYDPGAAGNSVVRATLVNQEVAVCGTGNLGHVGVFRVRARVYATATANIRLSWQEGDGAFRANETAQTVTTGWNDVDLGIVNIPQKLLGTQKWSARILASLATVSDADTTNFLRGAVGTDTIDVDYLIFIPAGEGYAKARGSYSYFPGAVVARDEFTGITAATALNARVAPAGGTWATSGATTDFAAADAPLSTDETEARSTISDTGLGRFAVLGATNYTDVEVGVSIQATVLSTVAGIRQGVVARWTDANNHLQAYVLQEDIHAAPGLYVVKVVAGTATFVATGLRLQAANTWYAVRLVVFASGYGVATLLGSVGQTVMTVPFTDPVLATGGTLATGKPGFMDHNSTTTASTRYYDNFYVATPSAEPIVVYSGRAAEFRSDANLRQDSTGTYYGEMPSAPRGAHFYLPQAGNQSRTSRIVGKARRNDIDAAADDQIADSTTWTVHYTPRYWGPPR